MAYILFSCVRQQISVPAVLAALGRHPRQVRPGSWRCGCPVHRSRGDRPGTLTATLHAWFCHKCHQYGDVVDLWALTHGLPPGLAAEDLCAAFGVPPPYGRRGGTEERHGGGARGGA